MKFKTLKRYLDRIGDIEQGTLYLPKASLLILDWSDGFHGLNCVAISTILIQPEGEITVTIEGGKVLGEYKSIPDLEEAHLEVYKKISR